MTFSAAEATNYGNLANALCALSTAYISTRSLYIWYRYLSRASKREGLNSLRLFFRNRVAQNPPSAFVTWDLPVATAGLILASVASVALYVVALYLP
jgi:hypothetical protein